MKIKRKQQTITFEVEKKILDYIAPKICKYVNADTLSLFALLGAILTGISYVISARNLSFLYLASLGLFIHWFGDSLDGRVARLRNENRPKYGHYLDHTLDGLSVVIIIFGINFSGLTLQTPWVWILALFLLIMIHSHLKSSVTGVFELSFERFGGTEARIGMILMNFILIFTNNPLIIERPIPFNLLDVIGFFVACILGLLLIKSVSVSLWGKNKIKD